MFQRNFLLQLHRALFGLILCWILPCSLTLSHRGTRLRAEAKFGQWFSAMSSAAVRARGTFDQVMFRLKFGAMTSSVEPSDYFDFVE